MRIAHPRRFLIPVALAALLGLAVAISGAAAGTNAGAAMVKLRSTSLGKVLVDSRGRTLYLYTPDSKNKSTCYGQCASYWPPLLTSATPKAGSGVKSSLLGETMRTDGKQQVTYKGHPLYFFAQDTKAGQVNGENFEKIWFAVSAAGAGVKPGAKTTSSTPPPTTTTTPAPGGYDYGGGSGG